MRNAVVVVVLLLSFFARAGSAQCPSPEELRGKTVIISFSGGPDAAALAARLLSLGARPVPIYIAFRSREATMKDLEFAKRSATLLGLGKVLVHRASLGDRHPGERNRFFIEQLKQIATAQHTDLVAMGTFEARHDVDALWTEVHNDDLKRDILDRHAASQGLRIVTWDCFGVKRKADQFIGLTEQAKMAVCATTSCWYTAPKACGACPNCIDRRAAFLEVFGVDSTEYEPAP